MYFSDKHAYINEVKNIYIEPNALYEKNYQKCVHVSSGVIIENMSLQI